jgi:CRISPR/Cas system CSM-associated protein Csm3 (group 7 of RAMP superfamily)
MQLQDMRGGVQHEEGNRLCKCDVCALFGAAGNTRGKLSIGSLVSHKAGPTATEQRVGSQVDRLRRVVEDDKLYAVETVNPEACGELVGEISGYDITADQEELLLESIKRVEWLGGNTSRGLGCVQLTCDRLACDQLTCDNQRSDITPATPKSPCAHTRAYVQLTPQSPMYIGKRTRQSNFRDTLDYIPGEVMRASLAAVITAECGGKSDKVNWVTAPESEDDTRYGTIRRVFGDIRFSAFRPFGLMPYPLTSKAGKYCDHIMDTLAYKLNGHVDEVFCNKGHCVRARTDGKRGWRDCKTSEYMAITTRSSINSRLGVVQDELLFSEQVLVPRGNDKKPLRFSGWIEGDFDEAELRQLLSNPLLRVGALKSIGYGKVKGEIIKGDADDVSSLKQRIDDFNCLLTNKDAVYIPLLLLSDAVIDAPSKGEEDALCLLKERLPDFKWYKAFVRAQRWSGVHTSVKPELFKDPRKCPRKSPQLLLEAGSVFVIKADGLSDELLSNLLKLETELPRGMELRVADEFHVKEAIRPNE